MNKFQPIRFRNIDDLLDYLPEEERAILQALRRLVYECIPGVKEKLSYQVPYFKVHRNICFIWPASVPWGGVREGVAFGFTHGNLIPDESNYLHRGRRKSVRTVAFRNVRDIDFDTLRQLIFEAVLIDKELAADP